MNIIEKFSTLLDLLYSEINEIKGMMLDKNDITDEINADPQVESSIKKEVEELIKKYEEQGIFLPPDIFIIELHKMLDREIDKRMQEKNKIIKERRNKVKKEIDNVKDIITLLKKDKINLDEVYEKIKELNLSDNIKAEYMGEISLYAEIKNTEFLEKIKLKEEKNKQKEIIVEKEEIAEENIINNYELIEPLFQKYGDLFSQSIEKNNLEEFFSEADLNQILNLSFWDIDSDIFDYATMTLLTQIDRTTDEEKAKMLVNNIEKICKKYELLSNVRDVENILEETYKKFNLKDEESNFLATIQDKIIYIKNIKDEEAASKLIEEIYNAIYTIRKQKFTELINQNEKLQSKAFILFDYDPKEKVPYVLSDLDEKGSKNQIDDSIEKYKMVSNGYNDFNDLIDDLILYGAPEIALENTDKLNKLIRPVYYNDSAYSMVKSKMKNATGMFRIRPRISTYLRFIDEKIVFAPNTEKLKQISELLESRLPNISIDNSKSFTIFINYLDSLKLKDTDSYSISQKRRGVSELKELIYTKNETYTDEELFKIGKIIDMTLEAYQKLKIINNSFKFDAIEKLQENNEKQLKH